MTLEIIGISVLWLFLFGYVIVASIDFGAGFFNAYSTLRGKQHILTKIIQRYLSPVWEVTNVFFVFFFVGIHFSLLKNNRCVFCGGGNLAPPPHL